MSNETRPVSQIIRDRLHAARPRKVKAKKDAGKPRFFANDNISDYIEPGELQLLEDELTTKMQEVLRTLVIDVEKDHNSEGTARRVAKMMIHETLWGRFYPMPKVTDFPNVSNYDQIYVVGPATVNSLCSHHHQNIVGKAWVGVYPSDKVIGLSKFSRITDWIMRRPQIQEEATTMLADTLQKVMHEPRGLAVIIKASHGCTSCRGVKEPGMLMTTSNMRGTFLNSPDMRAELMQLIALQV